MVKAIKESSRYYLLGWQTEEENVKNESFHQIEIIVRGKPQLQVKFQSGYLTFPVQSSEVKKKKDAVKETTQPKETQSNNQNTKLEKSEREMQKALFAYTPVQALKTDVLLNYLQKKTDGIFLSGNIQINGNQIELVKDGGENVKKVEVIGIIYDSDGKKVDSFDKLLTTNYSTEPFKDNIAPDVYYDFQTKLISGLYQVRIAARDVQSGRVGSSIQWIKIPEMNTDKLQLSSLFISERKNQNISTPNADEKLNSKTFINASKHFPRTSFLQYQFYIYNISPRSSENNFSSLDVQLQVINNGKSIANIPFNQNSLVRDETSQILCAAEISLNALPSGNYQLQVKVNDKILKTEAIQTINFKID